MKLLRAYCAPTSNESLAPPLYDRERQQLFFVFRLCVKSTLVELKFCRQGAVKNLWDISTITSRSAVSFEMNNWLIVRTGGDSCEAA